MSYGDVQLAAIERSRERCLARGSASLHGIARSGQQAIQRRPLTTAATVVVVGLGALKASRVSRRMPRFISRLSTSALGLLKFEGVLTVLRSFSGGTTPRDSSSTTVDPATAQQSPTTSV